MNILIVEDDRNKVEQISEYLHRKYTACIITTCASYQSGLKYAVEHDSDVILLDMTMPTFDVRPDQQGGRIRPYAGRDVMRELHRRRLKRRVIVVTQFESFHDRGEVITLTELDSLLRSAFPDIFVSTIYYSSSEVSWMSALESAIALAMGGTAQ